MSPTPLSDLEQDLPPPRDSAAPVVLGIGISVLFYVLWKTDSLNFNPLLFFPAMYAFVFVHEMGHAVAAWAVGWGISAMSVGGLVVHRVRGRHLLRFDARLCLYRSDVDCSLVRRRWRVGVDQHDGLGVAVR